jgi:hypothetical protein
MRKMRRTIRALAVKAAGMAGVAGDLIGKAAKSARHLRPARWCAVIPARQRLSDRPNAGRCAGLGRRCRNVAAEAEQGGLARCVAYYFGQSVFRFP